MVKDKSLGSNPALDFHKKRKKDSINKSKLEKGKLRDSQLQKRRPDQVQRQIDELQGLAKSGKISAHDNKNLDILQRDLARIKKLQSEGRAGPIVTSERTKALDLKAERHTTKLPKHPEKSFYYDPIYNPYGVPPPGMPYRERSESHRPEDESDTSTTSSVARIPMPAGSPPPVFSDESVTSSDPRQTAQLYESPGTLGSAMQDKMPGRMLAPNPHAKHQTTGGKLTSQISYSAEPVMKDLRREAAQFMPKSLKRKATESLKSKQLDPLYLDVMYPGHDTDQDNLSAEPQLAGTAGRDRKRLNLAPAVP